MLREPDLAIRTLARRGDGETRPLQITLAHAASSAQAQDCEGLRQTARGWTGDNRVPVSQQQDAACLCRGRLRAVLFSPDRGLNTSAAGQRHSPSWQPSCKAHRVQNSSGPARTYQEPAKALERPAGFHPVVKGSCSTRPTKMAKKDGPPSHHVSKRQTPPRTSINTHNQQIPHYT